jgi:hypothetical protein
MQRRSRNDGKEWIRGAEQHNYLGRGGDMVVDEAASAVVVEFGEGIAVETLEQEAFKYVVAYQEDYDERDGQDEAGQRSEHRYLFVYDHGNLGTAIVTMVKVIIVWRGHVELKSASESQESV